MTYKRYQCAIILDNSQVQTKDYNGCILDDGHDGPHEFVDKSGEHWNWESDLDCQCDHCRRNEGDYCTIYWRKN